MLAIDTNVVVRLLTADEPDQTAAARALLAENTVFASTTVILEAEWVLRSAYRLSAGEALQGLGAFLGLPSVTVQEPERVARALDWAGRGMDFADALHLAGAAACEAFATFDRRLARAAAEMDVAVRVL